MKLKCYLCNRFNLAKSSGLFINNSEKSDKPRFACKYCIYCINCDTVLTQEKIKGPSYDFYTNLFSDWNLINIKIPHFNFGGWAFMSQKELDEHYIDSKGLLCGDCKILVCTLCTKPKINNNLLKMVGVCNNPCTKCGYACDHKECVR